MSIHWWMALCYLALFLGGTLMARLDRDVFLRGSLYDVHKSIGVLTLALLGWRIFVLLQVWWKKYSKRWPKTSPKWWQSVALHAGLYFFMVAVPVAGFLLSNSFKANNVTFFGLPVPDVFPENKGMVEIGRSLHFWLAYVFLCFIILHAMLQWKVVKANWRRFTGFMRIKPSP
jgi:cytochrome b561